MTLRRRSFSAKQVGSKIQAKIPIAFAGAAVDGYQRNVVDRCTATRSRVEPCVRPNSFLGRPDNTSSYERKRSVIPGP